MSWQWINRSSRFTPSSIGPARMYMAISRNTTCPTILFGTKVTFHRRYPYHPQGGRWHERGGGPLRLETRVWIARNGQQRLQHLSPAAHTDLQKMSSPPQITSIPFLIPPSGGRTKNGCSTRRAVIRSLYGLSGAGKSTLATAMEKPFSPKRRFHPTADGDNIRRAQQQPRIFGRRSERKHPPYCRSREIVCPLWHRHSDLLHHPNSIAQEPGAGDHWPGGLS